MNNKEMGEFILSIRTDNITCDTIINENSVFNNFQVVSREDIDEWLNEEYEG